MDMENIHGGARKGAGRKVSDIKRRKHNLAFSDEEWAELIELAGSERKVARFIMEMTKQRKQAL